MKICNSYSMKYFFENNSKVTNYINFKKNTRIHFYELLCKNLYISFPLF